MRSMILVVVLATGCMTDPDGDSCVWAPGNDGYCPEESHSGSRPEPPKFHSYFAPAFVRVGGEPRVMAWSSGEDYAAFEEIVGGYHVATAINGQRPAIACGDVCAAAWKGAANVMTSVRTDAGWTTPLVHESAIQAPAIAVYRDRIYVAWETFEGEEGRVELRRLSSGGAITGRWTVARGVAQGHISLAASERGALLTWQRFEVPASSTGQYDAWVVAQPLAIDGSPIGVPFEHAVGGTASAYYTPAPSAFVDGAYRVTQEWITQRGVWLVIDAEARTMREETIGTLPFPRTIREIVPLERGAVLAMSDDDQGVVARVIDDRIVDEVAVGNGAGAPAVVATQAGIGVAYAYDGSLYVEDWTVDFVGLGESTRVAEQYELSSGCSTGRSGGVATLVLALAGMRRRRRRA